MEIISTCKVTNFTCPYRRWKRSPVWFTWFEYNGKELKRQEDRKLKENSGNTGVNLKPKCDPSKETRRSCQRPSTMWTGRWCRWTTAWRPWTGTRTLRGTSLHSPGTRSLVPPRIRPHPLQTGAPRRACINVNNGQGRSTSYLRV